MLFGFHTVQCGIDPGYRRFRPRLFGFVNVSKGFKWDKSTPSSARGTCLKKPRQSLVLPMWLDFHTVRGSIDLRDLSFGLLIVGVVDVWRCL